MMHPWLKKVAPLAGLVVLAPISAIAFTNLSFGSNGRSTDIDPVYNVCRGVDPDCYSDWGIERDNKVLVYSRTAGPRHANLGQTLDPDNASIAGLGLPRPYVITHAHTDPAVWPRPLDSSNVAQVELVRMLAAEGIEVHVTEDVRAIEKLSDSYKAVIFMSPTRDTLWNHARGAVGGTRLDRARESLKKYIEGGGGFVGVHNALRHRVRLAVVRRPARQLELLQPRAEPGRRRRHRQRPRCVDQGPARDAGRSRTSGTTSSRSRPT